MGDYTVPSSSLELVGADRDILPVWLRDQALFSPYRA